MDTTPTTSAQAGSPPPKRPGRAQQLADVAGGLGGAHHGFWSVGHHLAGPSQLMWALGVPAPVQLALAVAAGAGVGLLPARRAARVIARWLRRRRAARQVGHGDGPK